MDDVAVSVKNLYKEFKLPHERKNSLKEWVVHFKRPTYERLQALADINFEVKRGEFFGIVGRNGSGKSTLLKIIAGIYQPTKGQVRVNGSLTPFIELGIGFNPELTGRENVFLNGTILGLSRKEIKIKYPEIVAFAELNKFMDQKLKNYSSGMQVRLAFAIAIQAHNDILLIDEVLAVGDAAFQRKCFGVFKDIKKRGKTVIFVTHDMGAVQQYCDRAMMIADSKVMFIGSPREVALRYEIANLAPQPATSSSVKSTRPTNPSVKLLSLRTRSPQKATSHFEKGEDVLVDIEFRVTKLTDPIQFNLFLVRPDGRYLAGINTTDDLARYQPKAGKNRITCRLKSGQLTKGDYFVNAAVYSHNSELIDILDASYDVAVPIITILESSSTQNGEFYISGSWSQSG